MQQRRTGRCSLPGRHQGPLHRGLEPEGSGGREGPAFPPSGKEAGRKGCWGSGAERPGLRGALSRRPRHGAPGRAGSRNKGPARRCPRPLASVTTGREGEGDPHAQIDPGSKRTAVCWSPGSMPYANEGSASTPIRGRLGPSLLMGVSGVRRGWAGFGSRAGAARDAGGRPCAGPRPCGHPPSPAKGQGRRVGVGLRTHALPSGSVRCSFVCGLLVGL